MVLSCTVRPAAAQSGLSAPLVSQFADLLPETLSWIDVRIWTEKGEEMAKRKHTPEEIINKLREAEVVIAAGSIVADAAQLPRGVRQDGGTLGRRGGDHPQDLLKLARTGTHRPLPAQRVDRLTHHVHVLERNGKPLESLRSRCPRSSRLNSGHYPP